MRRALLYVLAAAVVVVAGWSAVISLAAPVFGVGVIAVAPATAFEGDAEGADPSGADVGAITRTIDPDAVVAPLVLKAAVPVLRMIIERAAELVSLAVVVLAALAVTFGLRPTWAAERGRGGEPRSAPVLATAPRRGPPAGRARPSGT